MLGDYLDRQKDDRIANIIRNSMVFLDESEIRDLLTELRRSPLELSIASVRAMLPAESTRLGAVKLRHLVGSVSIGERPATVSDPIGQALLYVALAKVSADEKLTPDEIEVISSDAPAVGVDANGASWWDRLKNAVGVGDAAGSRLPGAGGLAAGVTAGYAISRLTSYLSSAASSRLPAAFGGGRAKLLMGLAGLGAEIVGGYAVEEKVRKRIQSSMTPEPSTGFSLPGKPVE